MLRNNLKPLIVCMFSTVVLSGCGSLGIGADDFSCEGGKNEGIYGSTRTIYNATNSELQDRTEMVYYKDGEKYIVDTTSGVSIKDQVKSQENNGKNNKSKANSNTQTMELPRAQKRKNNIEGDNLINKDGGNKESEISHEFNIADSDRPLYTYTNDGIPIRTPTVVMRIWVSPWTDKTDDLHMSGLMFTDVVPRKWQITNATSLKSENEGYFRPYKPSSNKQIEK